MKINNEIIPHIEKAIGFELYNHQVNYLLGADGLKTGRGTGKTVAYCIKLALSEGEPLNMSEPYKFSDYGDGTRRYAYLFFRKEFMKYRELLKEYGFPVRAIKS